MTATTGSTAQTTRRRLPRGFSSRKTRTAALAGALVSLFVGATVLASTPPPADIFEITDGNVVDGSPANPAQDWANAFSGSGGTSTTLPTVTNSTLTPFTAGGHTATPVPGTQVFVRDPLAFDKLNAPWQSEKCTNAGPTNAGDTTVYTGAGGEKNGDAFSSMTWAAGSIPNNKDDLSNVYSVAYRDDAGDIVIYFALERVAHNGSSHLDVEFLHSAVGRTRTGTDSNGCPKGAFQGDRTDGDVIVGINFDNGG